MNGCSLAFAGLAMPYRDCDREGTCPAQLEDNHMSRLSAAHGLERQASSEGYEPPAILDRQTQQINVRDLVGPEDVGSVEQSIVGDGDVVRPERVAGLVKPRAQCGYRLRRRAGLQIARLRHDADKAVLRKRTSCPAACLVVVPPCTCWPVKGMAFIKKGEQGIDVEERPHRSLLPGGEPNGFEIFLFELFI